MGNVNGRVDSLRRKHAELEERIVSLENSPSESDNVRDLKKEKLAIKDELAKISA